MSYRSKWFPNPYTIVFLLTIFVAILTHIVPSGHYDYKEPSTNKIIKAKDVQTYRGEEKIIPIPGTFQYLPNNPQGISDVFLAPVLGIIDAIDIVLFILSIGIYITMITKTGAFDAGISRVIQKLNNKENYMILFLIIIFSFVATIQGFQEESSAFFPILIAILIKDGYDSLTAIAIIFISVVMGLSASITNPFSVGIASKFAETSIIEGMVFRIIVYITIVSLCSFFIIRYAKKIKKNIKLSVGYDVIKYFQIDQPENNLKIFNKRHAIILLIFIISFITIIYSIIPFDQFGYPNLGLGWWFPEMSALFLFSTLLTGIIAGFNEPKIVNIIKQGLSEFIPIGFIVGLSRGITVILKKGLLEDSFLNFFSQLLINMPPFLFVILSYFLFIIMSFMITSTSAMATLTMPILAPLAHMLGIPISIVISSLTFGMGTVFLINPADPILNIALSNAKLNYLQWIKFIKPFFLCFISTLIIALIVGTFYL